MMQEKSESGFLELAHTADWALKVWGPDLAHLLSEAAYGMYALMEVELSQDQPVALPLEMKADDGESLLVSFLSELLYLGEEQGLAFDRLQLEVQDLELSGMLHGGLIQSQRKEIKAVTYHELEIIHTGDHYEATIVFDV
jgi:SHS2 domain-containing protein